MDPIGSGTIKWCGLVGGRVSLGVGFEVSDASGCWRVRKRLLIVHVGAGAQEGVGKDSGVWGAGLISTY